MLNIQHKHDSSSDVFIRKMTPVKSLTRRIGVKTADAVHLIKVDEIIRCLADDNYCSIFYGQGRKVMVAKTLKAVGETLPTNTFLRVHNSHIVRLDAIHLVYCNRIVLYNGDEIPLSRITKKELLERLGEGVKFL